MPNLFDAVSVDLKVEKSELLFLYESTFSMPNGDPFTGESRQELCPTGHGILAEQLHQIRRNFRY